MDQLWLDQRLLGHSPTNQFEVSQLAD